MPGGIVYPIPVSKADVDAAAQAAADAAATAAATAAVMAMLSNDPPKSEAKTSTPGTAAKATRDDHQHPRITSATSATTDANGQAILVFTRSFTTGTDGKSPPSIVLTTRENNTNPAAAMKVLRFMKAGPNSTTVMWDPSDTGGDTDPVTGCVVYASRSIALPTMASITGITLLTNLIPVLNTLFGGLSGFLPAAAAPNLRFSCVALQTSAV